MPRTRQAAVSGVVAGLLMVSGTGLTAQQITADPMAGLVISAVPLEGAVPSVPVPVLASLGGPQPLRPGLPRPSIVVGDMAVLMMAGPRGPYGLPHPAREAIRARDATMFARLLGQGAFDPDPDQLSAAVQSELARMDCYGGGVDGDWGAGSQAAVGRYVQAGGAVQADSTPDLALFRAIVGAQSVVCAAPVAAPAVTQAPTRSAPQPAASRPAATQPAAPRALPPPAAAVATPAPTGQRQINPGIIGSGVFR